MIQKLLPVSALAIVMAAPAVAQVTIEQVAPESTVLVVGSRSMSMTLDRLNRTTLMDLWNDEALVEIRAEWMQEMEEGLDEAMQELGLDRDSLQCPENGFGVALFVTMNEELGMPQPGILAVADYGAQADKTGELIQALLAKGEEEGEVEYTEKEVRGHKVLSFDIQDEADVVADDPDMEEDPFEMPAGPEAMFEGIDQVHFVRAENVFMLGTDLPSIVDALDTMHGESNGSALTDNESFQGIMGQVGSAPDFYMAFLTEGLLDLAAPVDPMGMTQMFKPTLSALFGDVRGMGYSLRLDGPAAMMEQRYSIYMPEGKQGLPALFDTPLASSELPAFVGIDALSYGAINMEFSGIADFLTSVVRSNPMFMAEIGEDGVAAMEMQLRQVTDMLGSRVHLVANETQVDGKPTMQQLYVVECTNEEGFDTFLGSMAPQMGFEGRDFVGNRIYAMNEAMAAEVAQDPSMNAFMSEIPVIGIGGGNLVIGPSLSVEQVLRGGAAEEGLAGSPAFQRAMATMPGGGGGDVVAWGYSDTGRTIQASVAMFDQQMQLTRDQMAEFGPEAVAEFDRQQETIQAVLGIFKSPRITEYFGPGVWNLRSTDNGFVGVSFQLAGEKEG